MKRFNILYGKEIPLDDKVNNSFFLYHTIYSNPSNESNNPISFTSNSYYSAVLYFIESYSFYLEIYQNLINSKLQEIDFKLKRKIKLNPAFIEYDYSSNDDIKMYFIGEKFILIENLLKKSIILDHETGEFTSIIFKGKKSQRKNIIYNPIQNSCDDLFKDDSLNSDKNDKNKNNNNFNNIKENNDSSGSINISEDNLSNQDVSNINNNFSNLKILYTYDEFYQQIIYPEKQNQNPININNINNNIITNTSNNLLTINNNENSMLSNNNNLNTNNINTINTVLNPSPINISGNNSFIFNKKNNQNKNPNQNHINNTNNLNINTDNLETINSNDISGNDTKKNANTNNTTNNYTTMNTNMVTTLPSSNQNTIDEIKILFNTKQNKHKTIMLKRSYIFMMDKNQLYYCIIDNTFDLNKTIEFNQTAFILDENDIIDEMKIIKINVGEKISYIIFLLSKSGLIIIPTDFCRSTLKNIILNNSYNQANSYKLYYKLDFPQDPLNYYHMVINYLSPQNSNIYILNKDNLITINLNLYTLKNFIKEELYKLNLKSNESYELGMEEKIELDNNDIALINKTKKIISFNKYNYDIKKLKISGYITNIEYMDGNFVIYDKVAKSLAIYYLNGEFLDKVENYKDVDKIFFFSFYKIYSLFFCMNNTFNKVSFNKKLYWYSQYFSFFDVNMNKKAFNFTHLKNHIAEIKEKYINGIFTESDKNIRATKENNKIKKRNKNKISNIKKHCEFCKKEIIVDLNKKEENIQSRNKYYKCPIENCQTFYCSEIHKDLDFNSFHFFHCKLNQFFLNYKYSSQINFYNDLILLINEILKYIFTNIKLLDDYLFFLPFIKMMIFIMKSFNMRVISNNVIELSQKLDIPKEDLTSLLFYTEVIFFYYNLILLSLNFGQRCHLYDFVQKELNFLSEDEEQFFSKSFLNCTSFNRNVHYHQSYINFAKYKHYFFVDDNYLLMSKYLRQNDILFSHVIHLYSNYLHLTDKLIKENQLNLIYFNSFNIKLLSQLTTFFQERNKEYTNNVFIHFLALISPYYTLNRKMELVYKILKKATKLIKKEELKNTVFHAKILYNLGMVQFAVGNYLEGIHNIEKGFNLIEEKDFSYMLKINILEKLSLAYLNIGELLKSFILIKQAMEYRTNLIHFYETNTNLMFYKNNAIDKNDYLYQYYYILSNNISDKKINYNHLYKKKEETNNYIIMNKQLGIFDNNQAYYENAMKLIHLFVYINYIQDFVEYENQIKHSKNKGKKKLNLSQRDYQIYLINYVLAKDDLFTKNKNYNIIDTYNDDYFRAIEFLYSLNKDILARIDTDNQTKKNSIYKEEYLVNQNNTNNIHTNNNIKITNTKHSFSLLEENNSTNSINNNNKKHNQENINNNNTNNANNNTSKEKEKNLVYDNEIEIKEDLYDKLSRKEQLTLTSINSKFFNRKNVLRDYFGKINKNNINYHPIYTEEFKKIITSSKHQFFVKILTQANSLELVNYFFPTSNNNLEGLSKYLQQEEIQNMFKVEKTKILSLIQDDNINKKKTRTKDIIKNNINNTNNNNINNLNNFLENEEKLKEKKEQWITNIKYQLLKDPSRSLPDIDFSLANLYDDLIDEYKEEISKNPELILYYIFTELSSINRYKSAIQLKKEAIENEFDIMTKTPELYYTKIKGPKNEINYRKNSFFDEEEEKIEIEDKSKRKLNLYEIAGTGILEERKLEFSHNSSSSEEIINNFDFDKNNNAINNDNNNIKNNINNNNEIKGRNEDELFSMKEVPESDEKEKS